MYLDIMDDLTVPLKDQRLEQRYWVMVNSHMHQASRTAAGPTAVLDGSTSWAATQAAWRFLNNQRVKPAALAAPLREAGRRALADSTASVGLLVHDWSKLDYGGHASKQDTLQLTHEHDVGYELSSGLLVSAADGAPLAPMLMHLATARGMHSTEASPPAIDTPHVDQVLPAMQASRGWELSKPLVHVIDREADSVDHYRQWDADGHRFLVRGDDRRVCCDGRPMLLSKVVKKLAARQAFVKVREVEYRGKPAFQEVAEATVTLDRPGRKRVNGKQRTVPGTPLTLRLIVSRIINAAGKRVATWMLLTNVSATDADAATIALWYYWRWRIESFFKLLKSHGQQIEQWQQETGPAIARRLLVAAMACVVAWDLQRQHGPQADQLKTLLVRLSGRQTKRRRPHTASAMLAGLFVLLPMLALIDEYDGDLNAIQQLALHALPWLKPG